MSDRPRTILHVDLDAFYASVEQRDNPALRGKPVIVGWPSRRGVVCAASYEARPFGVRSAMSMMEAKSLCPQGITIAPRMGHYAEVSRQFFGILERYSPLVEGLSLDEAFVDLTGAERLFGDGETVARRIKDEVRAELSIVVSAGVAPMKFVAKIASDFGKPDGLFVVRAEEVLSFLHPLPIGRLWGVGKVTEASLSRLGIRTIGDLARTPASTLTSIMGEAHAAHLLALAHGQDAREVVPEREAVSVGHEETFDGDIRDRAALASILLAQADEVCRRLRSQEYRARTITLKIKYANHELITRRMTLPEDTTDANVVGRALHELLTKIPDIERRGVRLTGVSLSGMDGRPGDSQLSLPGLEGEPDLKKIRSERLGEMLDVLSGKFGKDVVRRATHIAAPEKAKPQGPRKPQH